MGHLNCIFNCLDSCGDALNLTKYLYLFAICTSHHHQQQQQLFLLALALLEVEVVVEMEDASTVTLNIQFNSFFFCFFSYFLFFSYFFQEITLFLLSMRYSFYYYFPLMFCLLCVPLSRSPQSGIAFTVNIFSRRSRECSRRPRNIFKWCTVSAVFLFSKCCECCIPVSLLWLTLLSVWSYSLPRINSWRYKDNLSEFISWPVKELIGHYLHTSRRQVQTETIRCVLTNWLIGQGLCWLHKHHMLTNSFHSSYAVHTLWCCNRHQQLYAINFSGKCH